MAISKIKSNSIADDAITSDKVADGVISAADVADGTLTNAKLADGTLTNAKLADGTVENAKLADGTLTGAKLATDIAISTSGNITTTGALTSTGIDDNATANALTIDSSSNLQFNSGYGSVATAYGCRAWVNFDGTGTVAIRDGGNVSSITDNGTGDYTVNFTTNMPDTNYCVVASGGQNTTYANNVIRTVSALQNVQSGYPSSLQGAKALNDAPNYGVAIFR
jgi:hypothetical protein